MRIALASLAIALSSAALASADVLTLRDGRELRGAVRVDGDVLILEGLYGSVRIKRAEVLSWEPQKTARDQYEALAETLADGDADARYRLAVYARGLGLKPEARLGFERTLELDPEHPGARAALNFVRFEGRWIDRADYHSLLGHVRYRGRWISVEERALLRAEEARESAEKASRAANAKAERRLRRALGATPAPRSDADRPGPVWHGHRRDDRFGILERYYGGLFPAYFGGFSGQYGLFGPLAFPSFATLPVGVAFTNQQLLIIAGAQQRGLPVPGQFFQFSLGLSLGTARPASGFGPVGAPPRSSTPRAQPFGPVGASGAPSVTRQRARQALGNPRPDARLQGLVNDRLRATGRRPTSTSAARGRALRQSGVTLRRPAPPSP